MKKLAATSQNTALNTFGTFFYFFCQWLTTVFVVRITGYDSAGIFSIAVSFTNIFGFISRYGIRNYQLSDVEEKFSVSQYAGAYSVSSIASFAMFIAAAAVCGYDKTTVLCCAAYMLFKYAETVSFYYFTLMQKQLKYLELAISYCIKGAVSAGAFLASLWLFKNLLLAILIMTAGFVLSMILYDLRVVRRNYPFSVSFKGILPILGDCFPLMLSTLITPYMTFIVRFVIEKLYGKEQLGYYSSVSMVVVVMTTLASAVWVVLLPDISKKYLERDYAFLIKRFCIAVGGVAVITALAILAGELLGDFLFSLVFGDEILPYMYLLTPVFIASGLLTVSAFLNTVLIPLKKRVPMLVCSSLGALVLTAVVYPMTKAGGLQGANNALIVGLCAQIVLVIIPLARALRGQKNT